jgi:hypothetical protein
MAVTSIADIYRLRDLCHVTITAMRIALEALGHGYVDEDGHMHPTKQEYHGQARLL